MQALFTEARRETVWKIEMGPEMEIREAPRGHKGVSTGLFATKHAPLRILQVFSRQSLEGKFSEVRPNEVLRSSSHLPPTWTAGRLVPSGSASLRTSWVMGAVSPSPNRRKRNRYTIGLPSVHPK